MLKKNIYLLVSIIVILITGIYVVAYANGEKDVPKVDVIYNEYKLDVGQGSYKWKSNFKEKNFTVDSYAGVISKLLPGARVTPGNKLELNFDYQPKNITINGGYSIDNAPTIKDNIINIPKKNGTQIYFLDCEWKEGTVTYIIVVNIQR